MSNAVLTVVVGGLSAMSLAVGASLGNTTNSSGYSSNAQFVSAEFKDEVQAEVATKFTDEQMQDYFYLAATMWGEARGEGKTGMGYVGHVIMNRAAAGFRGATPTEVALYHKQFSCWNRDDPNREKLNIEYLEKYSTAEEREAWNAAKTLAYYIINGSADYTGGALHYHAKSVNPNWSSDYTVTAVQGSHIFYR
jgi:spore germination cell wall hydrolase CwlJ-like protein